MRVLALSGSLRAASENTRLLRVLACLAPPEITVEVYSGLGEKFGAELGSTCEQVIDMTSVVVSHSKAHVMQKA